MGNDKKKQDRRRLHKICGNKVSITFFLSSIAGIHNPIIYRKELTHSEVKLLFPGLTRTSFKHVLDEPESVYRGEVIMVEDVLGNIIPYKNPSLGNDTLLEDEPIYQSDESELDIEFDEDEIDSEEVNVPDINDIELDHLTIYELTKLLKIYADAGIRGAHRKVHAEITSRSDSRHASQQSKQRLLRKENKHKPKYDY